jgi:integrase
MPMQFLLIPAPRPEDDSPKLKHVFREWYDAQGGTVPHNTLKANRAQVGRLARGGIVRLSHVTPARVARYLDVRGAQGKSSSTIRHELAVLVKILRWLHRREDGAERTRLRELVADLVTLKPKREPAKPITYWTREEFDRLRVLAGDYAPWFRLAFEVAFFTGVRRAELRILDREDFDLEAKLLRIRRKPELGWAGETKTRQERAIPLTSELIEIVRERAPAKGPMFPALSKLALTRYASDDVFSGAMRWLARSSGIACRWHKARRSFATMCVSSGLPIFDVSAYLGHADTAMTVQRYSAYVPRWTPAIDKLSAPSARDRQADRRALAEQLVVEAKTFADPAPLLAAARALLRAGGADEDEDDARAVRQA